MMAIHSQEFKEFLHWVREDNPILYSRPTSVDGPFQARTVSQQQLQDELIQILHPLFSARQTDEFPKLIYGIGRARCGSTPITNVFGVAGMPAYYQPIKSMLRHHLIGQSCEGWAVSDEDCIFAKETFGPYSVHECLFQPVDILLQAGYPAEKIHIIVLDREPLSALSSWFARWDYRLDKTTLLAHFVLASHNVRRAMDRARAANLPITHYVYEASKTAETSIKQLFKRLQLLDRFTSSSVRCWGDLGHLSDKRSGVIFTEEPEIFHVPELHGTDHAYRFKPRAISASAARCQSLLEDSGVMALYGESVLRCGMDLEMDQGAKDQLFALPATVSPSVTEQFSRHSN